MKSYQPPKTARSCSLRLHCNESTPSVSASASAVTSDVIGHYPDFSQLQTLIGEYVGVDRDRIVVTAGGDEGIDRVVRFSVRNGRRQILTHTPTFPMVGAYCELSRADLDEVAWWSGEFPLPEFLGRLDQRTALAVVVTPNNPTGQTVAAADLIAVANAATQQGALALIDLAYVEFADSDPTSQLSRLPGVVMVRTLSKAWGLAGLRVGYLIASDRDTAQQLRQYSGPFPVSGPSLAVAEQALRFALPQMRQNVCDTRWRLTRLADLVKQCGGEPVPSQANFLLARFEGAEKIWNALSERDISVRWFADQSGMTRDWLRITCPRNEAEFSQFAVALAEATGQRWSAPSDAAAVERPSAAAAPRVGLVQRSTRETRISVSVNLDGNGAHRIDTGIGYFDHMLTALSLHSRFDIELSCQGDLHVDDHHTIEDCALALGQAIDSALNRRVGIERFASAMAPLDESLARAVVDLSGRPWSEIHLGLLRERLGQLATENITHFFQSLATALRASLHLDVLRGSNDHHRAEAAFKAVALALRDAVRIQHQSVPSTKGVL